jgi:hypothetical protein
MFKRHPVIVSACAAIFVAALWACEGVERVDDSNNGGCTTTSCTEQCQSLGYSGGLCGEDDTCLCNGADGDADADTDADSDADTDADSDADGDADNCDVDILFVYDTSGSMMDAVGPLTDEAFPSFTDALATYPNLGTVHVGVTTNLFGEHDFENGGSGISCDGATVETVQTSNLLTDGWDTAEPHDAYCCEEVPDVPCNFASGQRWIEGPSGSMKDEFKCVANVPCQEDILTGEPTLEAGLKTLEYEGNAGFIRDGALLVVVFITDEEDQSSMTEQAIHDGLLALKGGDENYVSVVTIAGPQVGTVEVNTVTHAMGCVGAYGGTEQTPDIISFTQMFGDHGVSFEMCGENDMAGALAAAFDVLELSCDIIVVE